MSLSALLSKMPSSASPAGNVPPGTDQGQLSDLPTELSQLFAVVCKNKLHDSALDPVGESANVVPRLNTITGYILSGLLAYHLFLFDLA